MSGRSGDESPQSLVEIDQDRAKTCTEMTPIPLPSDDYDHAHGMYALIASLSALAASTDASFDTIAEAIRRIEERIRALSSRVAVFRENIAKLDQKKDGKIVLLCPESYDEMLESAQAYLESMKGRIESVRTRRKGDDCSLMEAVRHASNNAVKASLHRDNLQDDGHAFPTDSWLDSAEMGVGAGRAVRVAARQIEVPPCLGAIQPRVDLQDAEYASMLDGRLESGASETDQRTSLESLEGRNESAFQDDVSVISALSTVTAATSSGRVTSRQRRRMQKEQERARALGAMVQNQHSATSTVDGTDAGKPSTINSFENVQSVQGQHLLGNQYLCDNLHDSYGVDLKGSSNVSDLLVFNTLRRAAS